MAPGEKLDPLPDTFILQPPVFQPVSSHSDWELPRSQGASLPARARSQVAGWRGPQPWARLPQHLPTGSGKALLSLVKWLTS